MALKMRIMCLPYWYAKINELRAYPIEMLFCGPNLLSEFVNGLPENVQLSLHFTEVHPHFGPVLPEQVSLWGEVGVRDTIDLEQPGDVQSKDP